MHVEAQPGVLGDFGYKVIDRLPGHRAALAQEKVGRAGILSLFELPHPVPERSQLITLHRMVDEQTPSLALHTETTGYQVEVLESDVNEFGYALTQAIARQLQQIVTATVAAAPPQRSA
jgi:hypothetical protein